MVGPWCPKWRCTSSTASYRGNRTVKVHAERFEAFRSPNWPVWLKPVFTCATNPSAILPHRAGSAEGAYPVDDRIGVIRLFPGIRADWLRHALSHADLRAVVLTTFGSGNGPTDDLPGALREAKDRGVLLLNVTQCAGGRVEQGRYQTSQPFRPWAWSAPTTMTVEAAVTKLMFLLGQGLSDDLVRERFQRPLCGEVSAG
jgi:L-asparaginase